MAEMGQGEGANRVERLTPEKAAVFPMLQPSEYHITSPADWLYNCIAHAAGKCDAPWWPAEEGTEGVFWPDEAPREETLDAFIKAYETENYVVCNTNDPTPEAGFEKIAIYVNASGVPTHAAREVPGGWTSKLGDWEDIEHKTLECLGGGDDANKGYGKVAKIMKRPLSSPVKNQPPPPTEDAAPSAPDQPQPAE